MSLIDTSNVIIDKGTLFEGNSAWQQGGAINHQCSSTLSNTTKCSLTLKNTKLVGNKALFEGGALKWNMYEPTTSNITMVDNKAMVYGDDIASVSRRVIRISKDELGLERIPNHTRRSLSQELDTLASGGESDFYFAVIDTYGNVVKKDNSSILFIK